MQSLPLKKLRNFGGKLGAELEKLGCTTAGEVAAMPAANLAKHFGQERANSILYAVQGYSDELVQVMLSCRVLGGGLALWLIARCGGDRAASWCFGLWCCCGTYALPCSLLLHLVELAAMPAIALIF